MHMKRKLKARIIEQFGAQYRFARELNVQETEISAVIRGHKDLEPEKRRKWARVLKCDERDIFTEG
jgi:hypothetical protein